MKNKLLNCLMVGALGTALALASPALAFKGGGHGGGMHGGGMGGGMRAGGMGGGMRAGGMGGGMHVGGMGARAHFGGGHFAGRPFAHQGFAHHGFSPRFAVHRGHFHHRHHRFQKFAFVAAPVAFAAYNYSSCWRRVWTPYGLQWVDVCSDYYGYGY
jgi:hypothetical protein